MKSFLHRHRHRFAFGLIAAGVLVSLLWRNFPAHPLDQWKGWLEGMLAWLRTAPFPLFVLLVGLLPLLGVPVTALYLSAGATYAPVYGLPMTLLGLAVGLAINLSLSYAAAYWFHGPVDRLLQRFGRSVPTFPGTSPWKVIVLVRITPGAPLMVQNLILGLARMPFGRYLAISLITEMVIAGGYLTAGHSFATGRWQFLAIGVGVVCIALLLASLVRDKIKSRKPDS